jgi:hypothetical protein
MFNGREIIRFGPIVQGVVKRDFCEKQLVLQNVLITGEPRNRTVGNLQL